MPGRAVLVVVRTGFGAGRAGSSARPAVPVAAGCSPGTGLPRWLVLRAGPAPAWAGPGAAVGRGGSRAGRRGRGRGVTAFGQRCLARRRSGCAVAAAGHGAGHRPGDLFLQRAAGRFPGHQVGDHVAHLGEAANRFGVPGHQQVQAALRAVMNGGGPRGRLVQHLLGLRLRGRDRVLRLLLRVADRALGLGPRRVACLLGLGPRGGDGVLGLLLRGREHPLGLLPRLRLQPVDFLLGVAPLLGDVLQGARLLRLGLVIGELEDLPHPLAQFLVRGLVFQFPLPGRGDLGAEPLDLIEGPGQPLLVVTFLATGAGHEFVDLTPTVAAHLDFEDVFGVEVRDKVAVLSHKESPVRWVKPGYYPTGRRGTGGLA